MIVAEYRICQGEEEPHNVFCHENQHGSRKGETAMATNTTFGIVAGDRTFEYSLSKA